MSVASLSNFLRKYSSGFAGHNDSTSAIDCRPARADEIHPALRLIIGQPGAPADDRQLADFLNFVRQRSIDLNDLWIVERGGRTLWAALPIISPGRTMLLFTSAEPVPADAVPGISTVLDELCTRFARRDVQLVQILLDPGDDMTRRLFEAKGFMRMAELIYLHAPVRRPMPPPALGPQYSVLCYSPHTHEFFAEAIISSYQNSLDCPNLNGLRSIDDIIMGHKSSGDFDPQRWLVLLERQTSGREVPCGVLLLSRLPRGDTVELVYLGLSPQARGRGLAEWMMRQAFTSVAAMGVGRLSLAVDSNNAPALKLYYRFGMAKLGSKVAMMRKLL